MTFFMGLNKCRWFVIICYPGDKLIWQNFVFRLDKYRRLKEFCQFNKWFIGQISDKIYIWSIYSMKLTSLFQFNKEYLSTKSTNKVYLKLKCFRWWWPKLIWARNVYWLRFFDSFCSTLLALFFWVLLRRQQVDFVVFVVAVPHCLI